jgi:hypothetical protein
LAKNNRNKRRLLAKIHKDSDGCWIWQGGHANKAGYGRMYNSRTNKADYAHRISYEIFKGVIPDGFEVCHTCAVTGCVNPDHLFLGSHNANMQDMIDKGRAKHPPLCGEANGKAILTVEDVLTIRQLHATNKYSYSELARQYAVGVNAIRRAILGLSWSHI